MSARDHKRVPKRHNPVRARPKDRRAPRRKRPPLAVLVRRVKALTERVRALELRAYAAQKP